MLQLGYVSREAIGMLLAHPTDNMKQFAYRMGYRTGRSALPISQTALAASPEYRRGLGRGRRVREAINPPVWLED